MGSIFSLILSAILGFTGISNPSSPFNSRPVPVVLNKPANICLDETVLNNGIEPVNVKVPQVLSNIKKPTIGNTTSGFVIPECQNKGGCDGPDFADYILVATNVKLDHTVYPNSFVDNEPLSDRQIVKQTNFSDDPILADRHKNRIYRTHCGDWCYTCKPADVKCLDAACLKEECDTSNPPVELPFRGSFHCDFIYYLEDTNDRGQLQIDPAGNIPDNMKNPSDLNVPADGTYYSVYFRKGAGFPKQVLCETKNEPPVSTPAYIPTLSSVKLEFPVNSKRNYRLVKNPNSTDGTFNARNTQFNYGNRVGSIDNPLNLTGTYSVYRNLVDPISNDYIYLALPGSVENALTGLKGTPFNILSVNYYLLERWELNNGSQKSLKLGNFELKADWVKKWVQESKPAIYIYPEKETDVTVKLNPLGYLTVSDPPYDTVNSWNIKAYPDGKLTTNNSQPITYNLKPTTYNYLYYEAQLSQIPNPKTGFIVKKEGLRAFLTGKLAISGLNQKEINDYLEYWLPRLNGQPNNNVIASPQAKQSPADTEYYLIYFLSPAEIETIEPIDISIPIKTSIRIRTYFKPLSGPISLPEQQLTTLTGKRNGNTLVEWGGILDTEN